jgi:lysophospholipase L1-like esterase
VTAASSCASRATALGSTVWKHEAIAGDGVHPNEGGYSLVAEAIEACPVWRDWIR